MAEVSIDVAKESSIQEVQTTLNNVADKSTQNTLLVNSTATHSNGTTRTGSDWAMHSWITANGAYNLLNDSTNGLAAIKAALGGGSYSSIASGEMGTSSSNATKITGKGKVLLYRITTGNDNLYIKIDGATSFTTFYGFYSGAFLEIEFNTSITFYAGSYNGYYFA